MPRVIVKKERGTGTAPEKRQSRRVNAVAGAEARRDPGRGTRKSTSQTAHVSASGNDLPGSRASSMGTEANEPQKGSDLSPPVSTESTDGGPTRSETQSKGAQERSTMRSVALDLGVKKICYSEAKDGVVVRRATVRNVAELLPLLGPNTEPARLRSRPAERPGPFMRS